MIQCGFVAIRFDNDGLQLALAKVADGIPNHTFVLCQLRSKQEGIAPVIGVLAKGIKGVRIIILGWRCADRILRVGQRCSGGQRSADLVAANPTETGTCKEARGSLLHGYYWLR